jgi:hypothetical protein
MTDLTITAWECKCDPNDEDQQGNMKLVIIEGNTTIWGCPHVHAYERETQRKWVTKS